MADNQYKPYWAIIAASSVVLSADLNAQGYRSSADQLESIHNRCGERWGSPAATAQCLLKEENAAGKQLASDYEQALRNLSQASQTRLRESQRAWLVYQKHYCELLRDLPSITREGPGFGAASYARCLLRTTLERLSEMETLTVR